MRTRILVLVAAGALAALCVAGCVPEGLQAHQRASQGEIARPIERPSAHRAAPAPKRTGVRKRKPKAKPRARPIAPAPGPPAAAPAAQPGPSPLAGLPPGAQLYGPLLVEKQAALWAGAPVPWTIAGLIEQESCASLKSAKCWNPRAELKTYREYGFGLGQITIAYKADHSERFNEFTELTRQYKSLHAWRFADRYDPGYQLTAVIEMTHDLWTRVPPAASDEDRWAFTDSSYNGGLSSLLQDRRLCANSAGCDQTRWFGNVETHSLKSKAPQKVYGGQSWYSINRGHVRNVMKLRRAKYQPLWRS